MKTVFTLLIGITSFSASAGGASLGREDVIFSMMIVAFLIMILGLVYLTDFISKIRKDRNFRDHLKARAVNLIALVRAIFQKKKETEKDKNIDFAVSVV